MNDKRALCTKNSVQRPFFHVKDSITHQKSVLWITCGYNVEQVFLAKFSIVVYSYSKSGGKWWKVSRSGIKVVGVGELHKTSRFPPCYGSW